MRLRFERDVRRFVVIGSVEGRPEAVREFSDRELGVALIPEAPHPIKAWIAELIEYLGEDVESVWHG